MKLRAFFAICALALPRTDIATEYQLLLEFIGMTHPGYEVMRISDTKLIPGGRWECAPFTSQGMAVWIRRSA